MATKMSSSGLQVVSRGPMLYNVTKKAKRKPKTKPAPVVTEAGWSKLHGRLHMVETNQRKLQDQVRQLTQLLLDYTEMK